MRREEIVALLRAGKSHDDVIGIYFIGRPYRNADDHNIRYSIRAAQDALDFEAEGGPLRRKGPWPVSYVRNPSAAFPSGEKVYRVGAGHDVPEGSLRFFGLVP